MKGHRKAQAASGQMSATVISLQSTVDEVKDAPLHYRLM